MVELLANGAIEIYDSAEIKAEKLYGYTSQLTAAIGLGLTVVQGGYKETLVLGYPGTGKSIFPEVVACTLNDRYSKDFSLVSIDCDRIIANRKYEPDLKKALEQAQAKSPTIVGFDEFEGCAMSLRDTSPSSPEDIHSHEVRVYLSERIDFEKVLFLCISNFPTKIDISTHARFDSVVYFQTTDEPSIAEMIKDILDLSRSKNIAKLFIKKRREIGLETPGHVVLNACKSLRIRPDLLENASPDEIAELLLCTCGPGASIKQIDEYEGDYRPWITLAEKHTKYWARRATELAV